MDYSKILYKLGKNLTFSQIKNRKFLRGEALKLRGKILDLGCGNGEYTFFLAKNKENEVTALDGSKELCEQVNEQIKTDHRENIKVITADAHHLPFPDNHFDVCFCNTMLEHVKDPEQIIAEISRVTKQGGKLIISIPFLQEVHADPDDFQRFTREGLEQKMKKYGWLTEKLYADFGALNVFEYLTLGSIVWRTRLGFSKNFPFGYIYILILMIFFVLFKIFNLIFYFLQKRDRHFYTMVIYHGRKI